MTDVGKIKLGVEIDADGLSAKLGAAVRKAIAPALARVQAELQKTQREYDKTGQAAVRSSAVQVAALKAVERQAEQTAAAVRAAQQAGGGPNSGNPPGGGGAGGGADNRRYDNRSTTNNRTDNRTDNRRDNRKYDQRRYTYSNKYDNRTINNNQTTYDHRVYNYNGPNGPGPGPGPGGGNGGNRRGGGGGGGGGGGVLGFLTSPLGLNALAVGASALPAVALGVTNIVGAVQQLGQAGLALPGIFAGGAAVIGTAVIGFKGLGDAVKELNEAAKSGDYTKANKLLADMAPAAQDVAKKVSSLTQGPLKDFQKALAQPLLDGVADSLGGAADKVLPRAQAGMSKIAGSLNGTIKTALAEVSSDKSLNFMDEIFGNTAEAQSRANGAIKPLVSAFGGLAAEGSKFLPRLGDAITKVSERFDAFISKNKANGNLFRWIDEGLNGLRAFGNAVLNVGKIITGLTKAAGKLDGSLSGDGGFLGGLERATGKWSEFVNSADGQTKITAFFKEGGEIASRWGDVLKDLWPALREIIAGFQQWGEIIAPIIGAIASLVGSLGEVPGLLQAIVVGFLAWRTIGGIIGGITTKLTAMRAASGGGPGPGGGPGLFGAGNRLGTGLMGAGIAGFGTTLQQNAGDSTGSQVGGALATIGGSALTGAAIGSAIPGVGTAIGAAGGAAIGTVLAGVNYLMNENATAAAKASEAQAAYAASVAQSAEALANLQGAQKEVNDSLLSAGGDLTNAGVQTGVQAQIGALPDSIKSHYGDSAASGVADALKNTGLSTAEIAQQLTGAQPLFDALAANLQRMGPDGALAAQQLGLMREQIMGMQATAQTASPALQTLADQLHLPGAADALGAVRTAVLGIPTNVPIDLTMANGPATLEILKGLGYKIETIDGKQVVVNADDQKVKDADAALEALGVKITHLPTGQIAVALDQAKLNAAQIDMNNFLAQLARNVTVPVTVQPNVANNGPVYNPNNVPLPPLLGGPPAPGQPPRHGGGVLPGYTPGRDVWAYPMANGGIQPLSGGEGILIPEAVRALGGAPGIYAINSQFRSGLSRRGYGMAGGGVFGADDGAVLDPHLGTGALPGPVTPGPDTELSVLISIRDLLAGKGAGPLATTAANTDQMATAATKAAGETTGPFGTPIKARNPGYEMAAAAIQALGGDPEKFLGADPTKYAGTSASGALSATTAMPVNYGSYAAGLQAFAASGSVSDVTGLGLDANDPVVKAIAAARNKKKGLGDDQISELIGQVFGGGFTGTLDSSNTSLVSALQTYREKLAKAPKGTAAAAATALPAAMGGSADALDAFAQSASGGSYQWGASDLSKGLSDCSGAVSDLVEMITKGQADSGRLFSTANAGQVLSSLGAVQGAVPGALQIGWSDSHMRATLPNGVNFESGGATGQGATYGGNAQGAAGMPNIMSLSAGQLMGGAGALGAAGGGTGTPVYVTNWPGQGGNGAAAGIFGAGIDAVKGPLAGVAGNVIDGITHGLGPAAIGPGADLATLLKEGNPLAVAAAAGFNVPDFTRAGGEGGKAMKNAADFTPQGQLLSDTGSLTDRTASSIALQIDDMKKQLVAVVDQVSDKLGEDALKPVLESAIQSGLEGLKDSVGQSLGSGMGTTAGPIIADATARAVSTAIPAGGGGGGGGGAGGVVSAVTGSFQGITKMAAGGGITGGTIGVDSVPIMAQHGEFVLDTGDVNRMGGFAGVEKFRRGLASGTVKGYATGGGVISNSYAGAEFFGVSQVPIIGAIVNALISVLLSILGIQLEERDTLQEMTGEFRQFRGDFKAYNEATGQLLSDTAAVSERTQSSTDLATQERVRILKLVISELIKFIFNQIVIPITKAVANSAIQAGASAAGMAINSQAPGAGSIVSSLISSAGQAGVDIGTQVWGAAVDAITPVATDMVGDLLQAVFPNIMDGLFSGQWLNALFQPLGDLLGNGLGGLLGGLLGLFGVAGGAATDNGMFDDGGMAYGMGYLPKATVEPERVLSPRQTSNHERLTDLLDSGALDRLGGTRIVHVGGITVLGSQNSADEISSKLTSLLT